MEMKYRGAEYSLEKYRSAEYNLDPVSLERIENEHKAKYRGQTYTLPKTRQVAVPQPVNSMTYRGVPYRTTPLGGTETVVSREQLRNRKPAPVPVRTQSEDSVHRHPSQTASHGTAELHRRNIVSYLRRRMLVAKAKGDRKLLSQLEQELQLFT